MQRDSVEISAPKNVPISVPIHPVKMEGLVLALSRGSVAHVQTDSGVRDVKRRQIRVGQTHARTMAHVGDRTESPGTVATVVPASLGLIVTRGYSCHNCAFEFHHTKCLDNC